MITRRHAVTAIIAAAAVPLLPAAAPAIEPLAVAIPEQELITRTLFVALSVGGFVTERMRVNADHAWARAGTGPDEDIVIELAQPVAFIAPGSGDDAYLEFYHDDSPSWACRAKLFTDAPICAGQTVTVQRAV